MTEDKLQGTYREILMIALPLILGNLAWAFIGITDQAFMGHFGKTEEAAIGPVGIFYSIIFMLGFGYSRGIQILMAKACGENNRKAVGSLFDNTAAVMLVSSICLSLFIFFTKNYFLRLLLHEEGIINACNAFMDYRVWGIPASFTSCLFIAFYSGIGRTKLLSLSVIIMAVVNIILNYGLVFGNLGLPRMGIAGSGLASTIAEWVSLVVFIGGLISRNYIPQYHLLKTRLSWNQIKRMTQTATPLVLQSLIANLGWFVFFTYVEKLGENQLALSNIIRQILMWVGIPVWALGSVTSTVVSNFMGQKKYGEVKIIIKKLYTITLISTLIQCFILCVFYKPIISLFSMDSNLIQLAFPSMVVVSIALIIMSISNIIFNGLVSVSGTSFALYIELFAMVIYMIYVTIIFRNSHLDIAVAWTTEWIYWTVILLASIWRLKKSKILD